MERIADKHYLANGAQPKPDEAIAWASETKAKMVDLKFCDLLGSWQHMTMPLRALDASAFDEGLGFDGSSIRGWQGIAESDMLLMPDPATAVLDPFTAEPTRSLICEIADPLTREPYHRDPRRIARRAEEHLLATGIADTAYFGPECEFFLFDEVSYETGINASHYAVDSAEGHWNSGKPGLGYTVREKGGYFPPAPHDTLADIRTAMVLTLERLGIPCEFHHHEVASGGQCEIDLRYETLARQYLGGLLMHAPALLAFCAPTTNSYRRLVPGYEAPVNLVYSQRNRSAAIRIPMYSPSAKAKRIEFRCPDATANPYLAFAAMLMAGIDGVENDLDPGSPADYDLFEDPSGRIAQVPGSLSEALDSLESDHTFLTRGGVFSEDLIRTWIEYKRENEVDVVRLRPHPAEFALYYDA